MDLFDHAPVAAPKTVAVISPVAVPDNWHICAACGGRGNFGVRVSRGNYGRWACAEHRDQVKEMR